MEFKRFGFISDENFPYLDKVEYASDNYMEIMLYIRETYNVTLGTVRSQIMKFYTKDHSLETVFIFVVLDTNNKIVGYIWDRSMTL